MNIKIILSYDGTNYHGWQEQQNARSVAGVLLAAIRAVMGDVESVQGVSRTDAGVHAILYTANFHTEKLIPIGNIVKALNSNLPDDIRVLNAEIVDDNFHSQFDCVNKTYIYRINNCEIHSPFERTLSWHYLYELDIKKMQDAVADFIGTKDFTSFCAAGDERENRIRTINSLTISRENDIVKIEVNADGFLYNMVRIIVGTLVEIGNGKAHSVEEIIGSKDRTKAGITAPPHGLYLKEAFYK
ncbi:MAG: tRNA pseudouridine(38-40) synthase TruA [Oscillospiraceae bacterium]|nr:tRNA pseudouridine(38-40) synthase TruA [Oscillospiraceae bacterium]